MLKKMFCYWLNKKKKIEINASGMVNVIANLRNIKLKMYYVTCSLMRLDKIELINAHNCLHYDYLWWWKI